MYVKLKTRVTTVEEREHRFYFKAVLEGQRDNVLGLFRHRADAEIFKAGFEKQFPKGNVVIEGIE